MYLGCKIETWRKAARSKKRSGIKNMIEADIQNSYPYYARKKIRDDEQQNKSSCLQAVQLTQSAASSITLV